MPKKKPDPNSHLPVGPTGVFVACNLNGDAHPERVALEIQRSRTDKGKTTHFAYCPFCSSRQFCNNWIAKAPNKIKGPPYTATMNIVQAEAVGLHPVRITDERKAELLAELGLQMANTPGPPGPPSWHQPQPPYVPKLKKARKTQKNK